MDQFCIEIRKATDEDIPSLLDIEKECFIAPWNEENLLYELNENPVSFFYVLEANGQVVGFCDYWVTFDSATIAQIAIHPLYQRNKFASLLMQEIIDDCFAKRVVNITLEVREKNTKAINLYGKFGFKVELVKKHYYTNGDNALYMIRTVTI